MSNLQQFFIAATGLDAGSLDMENITNNIANAQTPGFKSGRIERATNFSRVLNKSAQEYEGGSFVSNQTEIGSGVMVTGLKKNMEQGTLEVTNQPYDFAIDGKGFFTVRLSDGSQGYSRAGNFSVDTENRLVDAFGHVVEPDLQIPEDALAIFVTEEGRVLIETQDSVERQEIGQFYLATFSNASGLEPIGQNLFKVTERSGLPDMKIPNKEGVGKVVQFALEFSNANIIHEMMKMVILQRAWEIITKSVQTGEGMMRNAIEIARTG